MARTLVQEKPLRLALHVDGRCPLWLRGERRFLREIPENLVSNAVKFTQDGGVLLAVRPLELADGCCRIECEVIDTGIGIAPEALDHIFDSFTQANERILDEFGGTGLGLAICRRLVTALSGSVGVNSVLVRAAVSVSTHSSRCPRRSKPPRQISGGNPVCAMTVAGLSRRGSAEWHPSRRNCSN